MTTEQLLTELRKFHRDMKTRLSELETEAAFADDEGTDYGQGYRHGLENAIEQIDNYELPDLEALIRKIELLADDKHTTYKTLPAYRLRVGDTVIKYDVETNTEMPITVSNIRHRWISPDGSIFRNVINVNDGAFIAFDDDNVKVRRSNLTDESEEK